MQSNLTQKLLVTISILPLLFQGCVRRRLTVRTQPAGANVYVDRQYIGQSPISTSYLYYGAREIEAVGDGYRSEKVIRKFSPPWYQWPGLDFVAETLWPWELRDERVVDIALVPQQPPTSEVLQANANQLRLQASQGTATVSPGGSMGFDTPILPPPNQGPGTNPDAVLPAPSFNQPPSFNQNLGNPNLPNTLPNQNRGGLLAPGNRIPEVGILPGGGYRPEVP